MVSIRAEGKKEGSAAERLGAQCIEAQGSLSTLGPGIDFSAYFLKDFKVAFRTVLGTFQQKF